MGTVGPEGERITFETAAGIGIPLEILFMFGDPSFVPFGILSRSLKNGQHDWATEVSLWKDRGPSQRVHCLQTRRRDQAKNHCVE